VARLADRDAQVTRVGALILRTIDTVEDFDDARTHTHDDPTEGDPECSACWLATLAEFVRALDDAGDEPRPLPRDSGLIPGLPFATSTGTPAEPTGDEPPTEPRDERHDFKPVARGRECSICGRSWAHTVHMTDPGRPL
jgi:hypothetical protein